MGFLDAVSQCFAKYATFSGRARRSEYWFWILFTIILTVVGSFLDIALLNLGLIGNQYGLINMLFMLCTFVPSIAVGVRRLHDTDKSGWWFLLFLIPLIGAIILLVWYCTKGTNGPNRFGPDPLSNYIDPNTVL